MTPLVAVISPLRTILVPNTAAPSNWARGRLWIHYQARIQYRVHAWDPHLTLIIDFDFDNRCHVGQETAVRRNPRSEEHTSELQSRLHLVCRLLLEKKKALPCEHLLFFGDCRRHVDGLGSMGATSFDPYNPTSNL